MTNILTRAKWAIHARRERATEARRQAQAAARHQHLAETWQGHPPDGSIPRGQQVHHIRFGDGRYVEDDISLHGDTPWSGTGCFPSQGDHFDFDRSIDQQDPQRFQLHGAMYRDLLILADADCDCPPAEIIDEDGDD